MKKLLCMMLLVSGSIMAEDVEDKNFNKTVKRVCNHLSLVECSWEDKVIKAYGKLSEDTKGEYSVGLYKTKLRFG